MLNIKNPETYKLAREIANRTGETLTAAVTIALRERLARINTIDTDLTVDELLRIGQQVAAQASGDMVSIDEFLYGPDGLPR